MLEPLSAIGGSVGRGRRRAGAGFAAIRDRNSAAIATTSSIARPSSGPWLSPWPRWSNAIAASPAPKVARAKSWWFSLHEPAPWSVTTPAGAAARGSHSE